MNKNSLGIIIGIAALLGFLARDVVSIEYWTKHITNATVTVLKSEDMLFLATNRITTQVVIEHESSDPILGTNNIYVIAPVRMVYGMDLNQLRESDISVHTGTDGVTISVRLPLLELLACDVDFEKQKTIEKGNLTRILYDRLKGQNSLALAQREFRTAAETFAMETGVMPDRAQIIRRIDSFFRKMVWWTLFENTQMLRIRFS